MTATSRPYPYNKAKYVFTALLAQIVVTLFVVSLISPLPVRLVGLTYGFVYASSIGWLAFFVMPRVAFRISHGPALQRWTVLILALVVITIAGSLLAAAILAGIGFFPWHSYWSRFTGSLRMVFAISFATGIVWFVIETLNYRARYAATQARLASLESRIQPHFLFNTLNSIAALIPEQPAAAERMTERLAALLRFSLDSAHGSTITLDREIKLVTDYLEIEKTRFGPRLNYTIDIPPELGTRLVPPFCLQTLAENSVKYGGGKIRIRGREEGNRLVLEVWDSGSGFTEAQITPGHGLDNLRRRLALLWEDEQSLAVLPDQDGGMVRIIMPAETGS